jgi:hypothetical protein
MSRRRVVDLRDCTLACAADVAHRSRYYGKDQPASVAFYMPCICQSRQDQIRPYGIHVLAQFSPPSRLVPDPLSILVQRSSDLEVLNIFSVKSSNGTFINGVRHSPEDLGLEPYKLQSDKIVVSPNSSVSRLILIPNISQEFNIG